MAKINLFSTFYAYKPILGFAFFLFSPYLGLNQNLVQTHFTAIEKEHKISQKGKPVIYNSLGVGVFPADKLIVGGNHVGYRRHGFGISWRADLPTIREGFSGNKSDLDIALARRNNWQTGKQKEFYLLNLNLNYVIPITQKIPFYIGMGIANRVIITEFQPIYLPPGETIWLDEKDYQKFKLNFGFGIFVPVFKRVVLNVGYDHRPQSVFVGIAISGPFNYEDLDLWENPN